MPMRIAFYVLLLIWLIFGLVINFGGPYYHFAGANDLLLFILFLLLGWKVFGPPLQG